MPGRVETFLNTTADKTNQSNTGETPIEEGGSDPMTELTLDLKDEDLLELAQKWSRDWEGSKENSEWKNIRNQNKDIWLGLENGKRIMDNVSFQAIETFLAVATKEAPEPYILSDNTEEGEFLASNLGNILKKVADQDKLRIKVKQTIRDWMLNHLGIIKVSFSIQDNDITTSIISPSRLILEPTATIDINHYTGQYLGERKREMVSTLINRFPKKKQDLLILGKDEMNTYIEYIEWWTNDYVFWTVKDVVLDKAKNPHFNYEELRIEIDQMGNPTPVKGPGKNHFIKPIMPYLFISIFNLGLKPYDDTGLIQQTSGIQNLINGRIDQVSKNADNTNNSIVISGDFFTKDQAQDAALALQKGKPIWVPTGDVNKAIKRDQGASLSRDVYQSLLDYRTEFKEIFGVTGLTSSGLGQTDTVRGKIFTRQVDADRITGGVLEFIEQFYDAVYNYFVQMMVVYYDEPKEATYIGQDKAKMIAAISSDSFNRKVFISVKTGSLIPKDPLTKYNQAVDLYNLGVLSGIDLLKALDVPDPEKTAYNALLWRTNPMALFGQASPIEQVPPEGGSSQDIAPQQGEQTSSPIDNNPQLSSVPLNK